MGEAAVKTDDGEHGRNAAAQTYILLAEGDTMLALHLAVADLCEWEAAAHGLAAKVSSGFVHGRLDVGS